MSFSLKAHQPDISSTMLVEQENGDWLFQITAPLTAFQQEVWYVHGKESYSTPEEFNAFVLELVKNNVSVTFNKQEPSTLKAGQVFLGHETKVLFSISKNNNALQFLTIKNASFKNIHKSKSSVIILKKGYEKHIFTLSQDNHHVVNLKVKDTSFIEVAPSSFIEKYAIWLSVGLAILLSVVWFAIKRQKTQQIA